MTQSKAPQDRVIDIVIRAKDEVSAELLDMLNTADETLENIKKSFEGVVLPDSATAKVEKLEKSYKKLANTVKGTAKGIEGLSNVFNDSLFKGTTDLSIDWGKATSGYVTGLEKVAKNIKPYFEDVTTQDENKNQSSININSGSVPGSSAESILAGGETRLNAIKFNNQLEFEEQQRHATVLNNIDESGNSQSAEIFKQGWNDKLNSAGNAAGGMANIMQNMFVASGSKNKAMFKAMQAFSVAETTIHTIKAAQGAYAALAHIPFVGPALGIAAAAAAMAAGMARVNQIKSMKPGSATASISAGGKANPTFRGGSTSAYPVPQRLEQESKQVQSVTVQIYNPLSEQNWSEITENNIIPAINDATENRNIDLIVKPAVE